MAEVINWLHLSDLHLGLDAQDWLWPRVKHDLFRDLEKTRGYVQGWDLVFFTGDLTQTGRPEEFDKLNELLDELWGVLSKSSHAPYLCVVPGNHDLVRPAENSSVAKSLTQLYWTDGDLRKEFWQDPHCEYREKINRLFENFALWRGAIKVPTLPNTAGILPGDFSATYERKSVKLVV